MKNGFMSTFNLSCCLHGVLVGLALVVILAHLLGVLFTSHHHNGGPS